MIPLKIQMFLYIELVELLGWENRVMQLSSYYQRFGHKYIYVVMLSIIHAGFFKIVHFTVTESIFYTNV